MQCGTQSLRSIRSLIIAPATELDADLKIHELQFCFFFCLFVWHEYFQSARSEPRTQDHIFRYHSMWPLSSSMKLNEGWMFNKYLCPSSACQWRKKTKTDSAFPSVALSMSFSGRPCPPPSPRYLRGENAASMHSLTPLRRWSLQIPRLMHDFSQKVLHL